MIITKETWPGVNTRCWEVSLEVACANSMALETGETGLELTFDL